MDADANANANANVNGGIVQPDNTAAANVNAPVVDANAQAAANEQGPAANGAAQAASTNAAGLVLGETINALAAQGVSIAAAMGATLQRIQHPDWDPSNDGALDMQAGIAAVLDEEVQARGIELIAAVRDAMIRDLLAAMEFMGDRVIGRFGQAPRRRARVRRADAEKWGPKAREGRGDGAGQDGPGGSGAAGIA
ncbi:hypothetical protein PENSPDRAFT_672079 [Peniophora sp. CONT]|nr:hypothetical protein PENSPDRAFT_672079 [Peniophora sp. CONT]